MIVCSMRRPPAAVNQWLNPARISRLSADNWGNNDYAKKKNFGEKDFLFN
jgi:hypothetical protein